MSEFKDSFNIKSGAAVIPDAPDMPSGSVLTYGDNNHS